MQTTSGAPNAAPCALHKAHTPRNLTVEWHHIIPVAWQLHWQPAVAPDPGPDPDGRGMLWDIRGVWICPTGHRNVHALIVEKMRAVAQTKLDVIPTIASLRSYQQELTIANLALQRLLDTGGSLLELTNAREWGEA